MRIIIAAPPKTGNSWLKCLLAAIYDLRWLETGEFPHGNSLDSLKTWLASGGFPDQSVFHTHYDYSPELCDVVAAIPAHLATIIRDPYDQFVSLYFFVQAQADNPNRLAKRGERRADILIGKALDHPDTLAYLANEYGKDLDKGIAWLTSGRSVVVRYEALHADPHGELTRATAGISPVGPDRIANAIAVCQAESLLKTRPGLHRRIRAATAGDWRNHLSELHLAIMRDRHGERIRALGYDVQDVVL